MKKLSGYELRYNREPICPYCGEKEVNAWEIDFGGIEGSTEIECGGCEKQYNVEKHCQISYSTSKINAPTDN